MYFAFVAGSVCVGFGVGLGLGLGRWLGLDAGVSGQCAVCVLERRPASQELLCRGLDLAGVCGHIPMRVLGVCVYVRACVTSRPPSGPGCCPLNPANKSLTTIIVTINNK